MPDIVLEKQIGGRKFLFQKRKSVGHIKKTVRIFSLSFFIDNEEQNIRCRISGTDA